MEFVRSSPKAGTFVAAAVASLLLMLAGMALWPTPAGASAGMAAAGAAASSAATKCGAQYQGIQLYSCLAGVLDNLATRIQGDGNLGASLASQMRSAAATVKGGNKQASIGALSQLRSVIVGMAAKFKSKGRDETPGLNALQSAISTTIQWVQKKG